MGIVVESDSTPEQGQTTDGIGSDGETPGRIRIGKDDVAALLTEQSPPVSLVHKKTSSSAVPLQISTIHGIKWEPPTDVHLQNMLPQYSDIYMIGHGGMGAVYQAAQPDLSRLVAIKILPVEIAQVDAKFVERFQIEARSMARLQHPNIITVYDFGQTTEGQLYIVMEFVEGSDVSKMIQPHKSMLPKYAVPVMIGVCKALEHAHNAGVVHHDIKPANVLVGRDGSVKVVDFGLAKIGYSSVPGVEEVCLGTPDFVPPEALTGGVPDHRGDLYGAGVMFYQMLTGQIPCHENYIPLSHCMQTSDPRYDAIVQRAMMQNPDERYQSAREIRQALEDILKDL